jgi:hypothetical protein
MVPLRPTVSTKHANPVAPPPALRLFCMTQRNAAVGAVHGEQWRANDRNGEPGYNRE